MTKITMAAMRSKIPDIYENTELLSADSQTFPEQFRFFPKIFGLSKPNGDKATWCTVVNLLVHGVESVNARSTNYHGNKES